MGEKLTPKREAFVLALINGKTQREAYKIAGYKTDKMSDDAIDVEACKLLQNPKVSLRYSELMGRLEDDSIMTAKEVLEQLSKVGRAKITDFLDYKTVETLVDFDGEKVKDFSMVVVAKDSEEVDATPIQEIKLSKDGTFSFKLYSKVDALKELAKHYGLDKHASGDSELSKINQNIESLAKLINNPVPNREIPTDE